ncbi:RCC1/BLIP-II protein [Schizopora paradoxa]|uniref:RCC1/BLIP-II protein n=1 Tax=Schizopora paradoxa TaxID=27342 RepID=A0A0H2RGW0_9AGAM|nr:RCC1/BLIP-II protein [Schizopora paradoxa]
MPSLSDIPVEVLLDNLLPTLEVKDLLSLGSTSKAFYEIVTDDTFWKLKCDRDFNFNGKKTARTSGWIIIYKGLSKPKCYVWGNSDNGRFGIRHTPKVSTGKVPYPVLLNVPGSKRIVDLTAGGWSMHFLDSLGNVFITGTLDGEMFSLHSDGFSVAAKVAPEPLRLELPNPVKTLSCGRKHSMALDSAGDIWTFVSWGRPFRLITPAFDRTSPESTIVQVECGWTYNCALTASGEIYVWWPFGPVLRQIYELKMHEMDIERTKDAHATDLGVIPCVTWDLEHNPSRLPGLPRLPALEHPNLQTEAQTQIKIVKIAAMDNILIALTNVGHVLRFGEISDESSLAQGRWQYLPYFSDTIEIVKHRAFSDTTEGNTGLRSPTDVQITHISAHFNHFVAYSTGLDSIVLRGSTETQEDNFAEIIPELQYKSVISVVLGDYHSAALTENGKLYTWGAFSQGALGLGDPKDIEVGQPGGFSSQRHRDAARSGLRAARVPDVAVPTEVRFDHESKKKKDRFCFAVAAAGWHTGALVIDLDPDDDEEIAETEEEEQEEPTQTMPGHYPEQDPNIPIPILHHGPGQVPLMPRVGLRPYRIGYAGRGRGGPGQ